MAQQQQQQLDGMRQSYMNYYTDENIRSFYQIAISKKNFKKVYVKGENPEDNYFLDCEKRAHFLELIENDTVDRNEFQQVLLMLTDEELAYIGF